MPEGTDDQKNLMGESAETANLLAADKARAAANDNFQPYTEGPVEDNALPQEEAAPGYQETDETEEYAGAEQQAQLDEQEQADIAVAMAAGKQRNLQRIQKEIDKRQKQLGELEKELGDFRQSPLAKFLSIFQPRITVLIDMLIAEMKKQAGRLSDEAKIGFYTGLIVTVSSLIGILRAFKLLTAFLDAAFLHSFSCLRLVIATFYTIIIPIILILLSPLYIIFLAVVFLTGKIPLFKGVLTKVLTELIEKLKNQRTAWENELEQTKKKVTLRKQIKNLQSQQQQINRAG